MTRSKYPRSARKAAAPLTTDPKEGVVSPASPVPTTAAAGAIFTTGATLATPTPTTGTKRQRDDDGDENTFYGRRSAKGRSKGLKSFERKDVEQGKCREKVKGGATLSATPATTLRGPGKRLKFDPEVHGNGLESRLLDLQKNDAFEKMVSPRKKALNDTDEVDEWGKTKRKASGLTQWSAPRKIATPKSVKVSSNPSSAKTNNQELVQTEVSPEPQPVDHKISQNTQDHEAHETTIDKHVSASSSASLTLEKRLRELASPTTSISRPSQSRTVGNPFSSSPAVIKSSKPLTKPSFELPGDAHMKKRAIEREERKKRMEEAEKQKDEAKKQQQLQERFKSHMEKKIAKKDQQQGSTPQVSTASPPAVHSTDLFSPTAPKTSVTVPTTITSKPEQTQPSNSRRLTLDEVNQQLSNESVLEEQRKAEEAVLQIRQEAAEKGKESARLWAEKMKVKAVKK